MEKLSVVIIALDEEQNLPRTLDAVSWADEILVVDSGSTDASRDVCERYQNCRFIVQPFLGYGPQKRFAVSQASHDWILSLDADEVPDANLQDAVRACMRAGHGDYRGYEIARRLVFMGRPFRYGNESGRRIVRLFDRRYGNFTEEAVHERVKLHGATGRLNGLLLHHSYRDFTDYFERFNRYTSLMAERMLRDGRRAGVVDILLRPVMGFVQYYLLRGNCMNGVPGFVYSFLSAYYKTVKYLKLYELQTSRESS